MLEGESIADNLNEFNMFTNQLSSVGVKFDDVVGVILSEEMQRKRTGET